MLKFKTKSKKRYLSFSVATMLAATSGFMVISACTGTQATAKPNIVTKDNPPAPDVVAKINGQNITEKELVGDDKMDFFELQKREYDLKMDRLNHLILEKMVGEKAKKANMSLEDYLNKKVVNNVKVSNAEYKKFIKEKHVPESQLTPQLKERIMSYLTQMKKQKEVQDYLGKLTAKNPVFVYFKKPKMEVEVATGDGPWWGGKNAKVTIVEFSDFQCPFCKEAVDRVHALKKKYGNKIKFYYRQFPLPPTMHPQAHQAARAALCVNEQGMNKFWKYHDLLFANQDKLDDADLSKFAKKAGADEAKFDACYKSKETVKAVEADENYGESIGVKSTPTFFIGGQAVDGKIKGEMINGALPIENFTAMINEHLNAKKDM